MLKLFESVPNTLEPLVQNGQSPRCIPGSYGGYYGYRNTYFGVIYFRGWQN